MVINNQNRILKVDAMELTDYEKLYRDNLLEDVIPFWLSNSLDEKFGGYFTCLDREGKVFDTDKFTWLQCREVWMFAFLYNHLEQKQEWLDTATRGAEFLTRNGRDSQGNWYFSLTREGKPLIQPYNIFSDCFAAMAFAQLELATGNSLYREIAIQTFQNILKRIDNPKGIYSKTFPGPRPAKPLAIPMILSNLVFEIKHLIEPSLFDEITTYCSHEVMDLFYKPELGLFLEHISPDGSFIDSFEGRLVMPGHSLEAMWFMMDLAKDKGDNNLIRKATDISLDLIQYGWDTEYGGLYYMLDMKGKPPLNLEWDQKLWWVHLEAILAMLKGYLYTGNTKCLDWFEKLHEYTWARFPDKEFGEWYGYLNRQGEVLIPLKGGKWKGCFHVPRALYQGWQTLHGIIEQEKNKNE